MKLIDLLARELITWPNQSIRFQYCVADKEGVVFFGSGITVKLSQAPEDHETAYVTREAWEAAAKSLQSIRWTGEGLPPVGIVCELSESVLLADDEESAWFPPGTEVEVGGHAFFKGAEGNVCVICTTGDSSFTGTISEECLRPLLNDRDKAVDALCDFITGVAGGNDFHRPFWERAYDKGLRAPE